MAEPAQHSSQKTDDLFRDTGKRFIGQTCHYCIEAMDIITVGMFNNNLSSVAQVPILLCVRSAVQVSLRHSDHINTARLESVANFTTCTCCAIGINFIYFEIRFISTQTKFYTAQ